MSTPDPAPVPETPRAEEARACGHVGEGLLGESLTCTRPRGHAYHGDEQGALWIELPPAPSPAPREAALPTNPSPQQEEAMPQEGKFTAAQVSALVREAERSLALRLADAEKQIARVLDLCDRSDEVHQSLPPNARKVYVLSVRLTLNGRHRYPCLNGSVCGEPSNCPPADD